MGRNKLTTEQKKIKLSITINRELCEKLAKKYPNKSKYIEFLIYKDLKDKNVVVGDFML